MNLLSCLGTAKNAIPDWFCTYGAISGIGWMDLRVVRVVSCKVFKICRPLILIVITEIFRAPGSGSGGILEEEEQWFLACGHIFEKLHFPSCEQFWFQLWKVFGPSYEKFSVPAMKSFQSHLWKVFGQWAGSMASFSLTRICRQWLSQTLVLKCK